MKQAHPKIKSLAKGLALLDELAAAALTDEGMALSKLAEALSAPRNTTHNLLQTLVACGYARQDENALYYLGPKCWQMGALQQTLRGDLSRLALPALEAFTHEHHEAAVFAVLVAGRRVKLAGVDAKQVVRVDSAQVEQTGIYGLPTGRVLLAQADEVTRRQIIAREGWPGSRWDGIENASQLNAACDAISASGHCRKAATNREFVALAVPVANTSGRPVGSVGCYAPQFRCNRKDEEVILNGLRVVAEHIAAASDPRHAPLAREGD